MLLETHNFEFGEYLLDPREKVLFRDGTPVQITPKVFQLLSALIKRHGHLVEKAVLMETVWPDSFVEDSNLTFNITQLRKALGDCRDSPRFIETVSRRGYRFIANVKAVSAKDGTNDDSPKENAIDEKPVALNGNANPDGITANQAEIFSRPKPLKTRRWRFLLMAGLLIVASGAAGFYLWSVRPAFVARIASSFGLSRKAPVLRVEKLTETGNAGGATLSPDGKIIAYVTREAQQSLVWLRQLSSGKSVPIVSSSGDAIHGISFSRDGEQIYYYHQSKEGPTELSRVSTLGGTPVKVLSDFHGGLAFSPDDTKIAFIRLGEDGTSLLLADIDGNNEKTILTGQKSRYMLDVAFSPDGQSLAYCLGKYPSQEKDFEIRQVNLIDGFDSQLIEEKWNFIQNIIWLGDNSGILVNGRIEAEAADQIWMIDFPEKSVQQITFDSSSLSLGGISSDLSKMVATQRVLDTSVWVGPAHAPAASVPIADAQTEVAWARDGRIVFQTKDTIKTDIWIMNSDGSGRKQLTASQAGEKRPEVSADGKFIVYVSNNGGKQNIWRMDIDGGRQTQLTNRDGESYPVFTPDSQYVFFNSTADGSLWKVPVEGGEAVRVIDDKVMRVSISPDGSKLAYFGKKDGQRKILVRTLPGLEITQDFNVFTSQANPPKIIWENDGKALLYVSIDDKLVGNLYRQSLNATQPEAITQFTSLQIFDFAYSPNGDQIALVRGNWKHDTVLLTGFR